MVRQATDGYHLSGCCITATILLPTLPVIPQKRKCKRAAYNALRHTGFTWHCSTQGLPLITITCNYRELLPHVFTLIRQTADGNFLWHYLPGSLIIAAPGPAINRCVALYCPDFPFI